MNDAASKQTPGNGQPSREPSDGDGPHPTDRPSTASTGWRRQLLTTHPWLIYVLPFAVFLGMTSLEPLPTEPSRAQSPEAPTKDSSASDSPDPEEDLSSPAPTPTPVPRATPERNPELESPAEDEGWIPFRYYPLIYMGKILAILLAMIFVWPGYAAYPWKWNPLSLAVGVVGVFLWVGLSQLGLEATFWNWLGWELVAESGGRSQYNPLRELADWPLLAGGFLVIRFLGLVAMVPMIEEFFLRGFVMRFVMADRWWEIPFGQVTAKAVVVGTLLPMLLHPGELLAAAIWFSLVTWLMVRTRNIWDCVTAHAVTNLLLGIYAVTVNQWQFL